MAAEIVGALSSQTDTLSAQMKAIAAEYQKINAIAEQHFQEGIKMMRTKIGNPAGDRIYRRVSQDSRLRPLDGLEKGTFDRRWSSM